MAQGPARIASGSSDATLTFSDVTTNNVSTMRHGFAPKLPNDAAKYLDGTGAWSTPAGGGGSGTVTSVSVVSANGVSGSVANASTTPAITLSIGAIAPTSVAATGTVTGSNLSGTNTGDQTSVTGNAGTATALQTARTINGVSFDGTAAITVQAAAGTLTGTTLASNVTASSLTSAAGGSFGTAAFTPASAYEVPITLSAPLSRVANTVSIPAATSSTSGYLTSDDWLAFNGKSSFNGAYSALSGIPATFAPAAHALNGASHSVSGLTAGQFLKATSATTFAFAPHGLTYSDVGADAAGAAAAITLSGLGGVPTSRTVNGHALTGNVSVTPSDLSLAIGTNTQAWSAKLDTVAALAAATGWLHNDGAGVLAWSTPSKSDLGLGSVENTAISTWTGSANLANVGTITSGTWNGTAIADSYISSAAAWNAKISFPGFGTTGTTAAVGNDSRLSDARTPTAHNQAWSTITSTPTTLSGYGITDAQGADSDLSALAGLSTTGLVARTGAGTAATRTITGTTNQVIVSNGDGVAGNPSLSLPQSIATTSSPTFAGLVAGSVSANVLQLNDAVGTYKVVQFKTNGVSRWTFGVNNVAETGSNSGSNFYLGRLNDVGGWIDTVLYIIRSSGNIGLGTSSPSAQLHTTSTVRFAGLGAGTLITDSSGNVTASSDANLKTVTGTFTRGLADVLKLTPRTYHWNEKSGMDTEDENVGFIAQEVLESIPEAVGQYRTSEVEVDGKKTKKRKKAELLTLSDRPLIAALVNAVKELKSENDELRNRIDKLEAKK